LLIVFRPGWIGLPFLVPLLDLVEGVFSFPLGWKGSNADISPAARRGFDPAMI
jgi:hypothetical protein